MSRILSIGAALLLAVMLSGGGAIAILAEGPTDLSISSIEATALYAGIDNTVVVNIANQTTVPADNFSVTLTADGNPIGTVNNLSITGNNDIYYWPLAVSFTWKPDTAGNYQLEATVDPFNSLPEGNKANNIRALNVRVDTLKDITVKVRVEGKNTTLWNGAVTFKTSTITDKQGQTYTLDHPTALGALDAAAGPGGFTYVVSSAWGRLSYVEKIGNDAPAGMNGWLYRVNWNSAGVGAVDYSLAEGAEVLFYYGGWDAMPLKLSVDQNEIRMGNTFTFTVEEYNGINWLAADNATVKTGDRSFKTDSQGTVTNVALAPGKYTVTAEKDSYVTHVRSNPEQVSVLVELKLAEGWNFISIPRRLATGADTPSALFDEVDTANHSIFTFNPQSGWVNLAESDVIAPLQGIWIYSSGAVEVHPLYDTNARVVPASRQLYAGWNAIGFTDFSNASANSTLTSVEKEWATLIAFNAETQSYESSIINNAPEADSHSEAREMTSGKGYWLYVTADCILAAIS